MRRSTAPSTAPRQRSRALSALADAASGRRLRRGAQHSYSWARACRPLACVRRACSRMTSYVIVPFGLPFFEPKPSRGIGSHGPSRRPRPRGERSRPKPSIASRQTCRGGKEQRCGRAAVSCGAENRPPHYPRRPVQVNRRRRLRSIPILRVVGSIVARRLVRNHRTRTPGTVHGKC